MWCGATRGDGVGFRTDNGIQQDTKLICVLPGSRSIEATKHLPIIERTLNLLSQELNHFQIVLPLADDVATYVRSVVQTWPYRITFTEGNDDSKFNAFAASNVALAWLLHQPGVAAPIIGPGSIEQLQGVVEVPQLKLNQETLDKIDEIFPPCGAAPEAYAW